MKFRKKPVEIEAVQWLGTNLATIINFMGYSPHIGRADSLWIQTLEGNMLAFPGDWIIRGVEGEFYPCKTNIFEATYKQV